MAKDTSGLDTRQRMTLTLAPQSIPADGVSTSTATVRMTVGSEGYPGSNVGFSSDGDVTIGPTTDHRNGTYTATITASETADQEHITATGLFAGAVAASAHATLTETAAANGCPPQAPSPGAPKWTDLDESFGCHGKVRTLGPDGRGGGMALQSDGKIVMAGLSSLVRYRADGSLDPSFGSGGIVRLTSPGYAMALQPDGKIVVSGGDSLSRYNSDGSPDAAFGQNGSAPAKYVQRIAIEHVRGEEKIVGVDASSGNVDVFDPFGAFPGTGVARYNADGSPDTGFGPNGDGTVVTRPPKSLGVEDVAIQHDGKIVVGGIITVPPARSEFALARYLIDGTLDANFNPCSQSAPTCGGIATIDPAPGSAMGSPFVAKLAIQPDGKILLADSTDRGFFLARSNVGVPGQADGTADP